MLYRLRPAWTKDGDNPYGWVDSADGLFGPDELWSVRKLPDDWVTPVLLRDQGDRTVDAFCSPAGFFTFSRRAQAVLSTQVGECAEWLPVALKDHGTFYVLHPLRACSLGSRAKYQTNPISKNITQIDAFDFLAVDIGDASAFYVAHPPGSAAAMAGLCRSDVLVGESVASAWMNAGLEGIAFDELVEARRASG